MKRIILIAIAAVLIAGCSSRVTDFTVISTKNFDLSRMSEYQRSDVRTEGIDTKHIVIFIPTGVPNAKEAIDRAIEKVPGAVALLDGVLSVNHFYIPLIYGQSSYVVRGTALIDPQLLALSPATKETTVVYMSSEGNVEKTTELDNQELADLLASIIK